MKMPKRILTCISTKTFHECPIRMHWPNCKPINWDFIAKSSKVAGKKAVLKFADTLFSAEPEFSRLGREIASKNMILHVFVCVLRLGTNNLRDLHTLMAIKLTFLSLEIFWVFLLRLFSVTNIFSGVSDSTKTFPRLQGCQPIFRWIGNISRKTQIVLESRSSTTYQRLKLPFGFRTDPFETPVREKFN